MPKQDPLALTTIQRRIMPLLARGLSARMIGIKLGRDHRTIREQITRACGHNRADNQTSLVVLWIKAGGAVAQVSRREYADLKLGTN